MSSESDEVAEDYRLALEDLTSNMRFEISNLTVIARENTEHALAIAEVLQQHILKAPPPKKLPALYVLDSIVKNVGTPYTLYFGRNLFKIFMESYAMVDDAVRKRMEDMLRTWKDPVPGSMDTRPVFSHELVRPIENALMRAHAASIPQNAMAGRGRGVLMPHRNTPTPPNMRGYPTHGGQGQMPNGGPVPDQYQGHNAPNNHYRQITPQAVQSQGSYPPPGQYGAGAPGTNVDKLNQDIQNLIVATQVEFSQNPHDAGIQIRLKALMDLQSVVQKSALPPDQLELIKNKVTELAAVTRPSMAPSYGGQNLLPAQPPLGQFQQVAQPPAPPANQVPQGQVSLDALLGQGALAALMARTGSNSNNTTPNPPGSGAIRSPPPAPAQPPKPAAAAPTNALSVLDRLRQAGLLLPAAAPTPPVVPVAAAAPPPLIPANIASILSAAKAGAFNMPNLGALGLNEAMLKQQSPDDIINALYDDLGPPCAECGRRFKRNMEGNEKRRAHMDWHFKVKQRSAEAEKRGTHRSWYVDQQDWLRSREVVDADHIAQPEPSAEERSKAASSPKFILVPEPSSGINNVCPICQEKFENKWLDTAQEWVWLDAVLVRNRAYHASCHDEATRDREGTPGVSSRRTPEPVLGKRKAESGLLSPKIRALKTAY
ncbi:mRNA cleavage factor complex component Pcf11 [Cordyceps fumosorosea ARSEF 2679]|uniref:mRNA cleavage factor complex component Pcf11 n=1 Tax=Cordyceps fumosorosea (strain ARSEF 2679) TaxID=1081104 RepID=A0A168EJB4_CORFA|nr:mRNA cleavage factor complex component Pcf11 [Cordyceps fumosorosea ARSEF 2679]OAA73878.1 mRNA cleavage factor complex component Pcf11 [Cordyceps fumosorosea ARSEF 2679]